MFKFDENCSYRMPAHFGGSQGSGLSNLFYKDVTVVGINYRADKKQLEQYVPEAFEILEPLVMVGYQKCCGIQWMGGGHYTLINVATPAKHIASGEKGVFELVVWENKTAPILGGREETGIPKLFADIPDFHELDGHITANASHEGRVFLELELVLQRSLTEAELAASSYQVSQLGWRYIPNIGRPGAALSHATIYPVEVKCLSGSNANGKLAWIKANPKYNPAQARIINALADLPILEYQECLFAKSSINLRGDLAREL